MPAASIQTPLPLLDGLANCLSDTGLAGDARSCAKRVLLREAPFIAHAATETWGTHSQWPAAWLSTADRPRSGAVLFALRVEVAAAGTVRIHVTAHESYLLTLDGQPVGRGPERGSDERWSFDTWDLTLAAGEHRLLAQVWCAGEHAPHAAMTEGIGFLLAVEGAAGAQWSTGRAPWTARRCEAFRFGKDALTFAAAPTVETTAAALAAADEDDREWPAATSLGNAQVGQPPGGEQTTRLLAPALLPAQRNERFTTAAVRWVGAPPADTAAKIQLSADRPREHAAWAALLANGTLCTVAAGRQVAVLLDTHDYLCAYPDVRVAGGAGATVRVAWSEAPTMEPATGWKHMAKGHRDELDGKCFTFFAADTLHCDGAPGIMPPLYWRAGRFVLVTITTAAEPLTITGLSFVRTGYPLPQEAELTGDARWEALVPLLVRTLRACAHDTYMDCPYFERLQYVGDTRLEALVTYALCRDDRLPRKAIEEFSASRLPSGLTQARFPARHLQLIPPFSLFWVNMVHDFATWRDDPAFVRRQLPGVRAVLDGMLARCGDDHLLRGPGGWNFLDWTGWVMGDPPGAADGNASHNWQLAGALVHAAELEEAFGDEDLARRWRRLAAQLARAIDAAFWRPERNLYAEDRGASCFTEHAQCLAVISGLLSPERQAAVGEALFSTPGLVATTLYFTHYLFAACTALGRTDRLQARMAEWFSLVDRGLLTAPEKPEPCRSDCHAWSSHPFFHAFTGLLGIQPQGFGFRRVRIAPPAGATALRGRLPHPAGGWLEVDLSAGGCRVELPPGVVGTLVTARGEVPLSPGKTAG